MEKMTDAQVKNFVGKISRQMENFAKNVGTDSKDYKDLKNLAIMGGLELSPKGDYEVASASASSVQKLKNMTAEKQKELADKIGSMQTWGEKKEFYEKRVRLDGEKLTRVEMKDRIRQEILKDEYLIYEIESFISEVYSYLQRYSSSGVYLDTLPSSPYTEYHRTDIETIVETHKGETIEEIREYVEKVRAEMSRGGQSAGIPESITKWLWHIKPEKP